MGFILVIRGSLGNSLSSGQGKDIIRLLLLEILLTAVWITDHNVVSGDRKSCLLQESRHTMKMISTKIVIDGEKWMDLNTF